MHRRHFSDQYNSFQPQNQLKNNQSERILSLEDIDEVQEDYDLRSQLNAKIPPQMNKFSYQYSQRQYSNQDYPPNFINQHSTQQHPNPSHDQGHPKPHSSQPILFQKQPHQAYTYETTNTAAESPFYISSEQLSQYEKYASSIDKENKGFIAGPKAREIFMKSKLTIPTLKQIWALLDSKKKGFLTRYEFIGMVHIVRLCSNGIKIPLSLPNEISQLLAKHEQDSIRLHDLSHNSSLENGLNYSTNTDRSYRQQNSTNDTNATDAASARQIRELNHQFNQQNVLNAKSRSNSIEDNLEKSRTGQDTQRMKYQGINIQDQQINANSQKMNQQPQQNDFAQKEGNNNLSRDDFRSSVPQTPQNGHTFSKLETSFTKIETSSVYDTTNQSTSVDQSDILSDVLQAFRETSKKVQEENAKLQEGLAKIRNFEMHSMKKLDEISRYFNNTVVNNSELSKQLEETARFSIQRITEKALEMLEINRSQNNVHQEKNWEYLNDQEFLNSFPHNATNNSNANRA